MLFLCYHTLHYNVINILQNVKYILHYVVYILLFMLQMRFFNYFARFLFLPKSRKDDVLKTDV